jgi:hypothetical protein
MAVVLASTTTVKADGFDSFLEMTRNAKAIFERCGASNLRLLSSVVAGEVTGSFAFTYEADSFAAAGAVRDQLFSDPDGVALMSSSEPVLAQWPRTRPGCGWIYLFKLRGS